MVGCGDGSPTQAANRSTGSLRGASLGRRGAANKETRVRWRGMGNKEARRRRRGAGKEAGR
eukprot:826470-Pyramimonas_sp.AAC.1